MTQFDSDFNTSNSFVSSFSEEQNSNYETSDTFEPSFSEERNFDSSFDTSENFEPAFSQQQSFNTSFGSIIPVYQGVEEVWIGGINGKTGAAGLLYVRYSNDETVSLGPVSAYAVAKAHGFTGTEEEWEAYIANASENARKANVSATNAAQSAADADAYKDQAATSASTATEKASQAIAAASDAEADANFASQVRDEVIQAESNVQQMKQSIEYAVTVYPRIDEESYSWLLWDASTGEWINTGINSHGIEGPQGEQGEEGPQGEKGDPGDPFKIAKIFSSVEEMEEYSGPDVEVGDFVLIASSVEDPDNAKIYVKNEEEYNFITNLNDIQVKGEKGDPGEPGEQGEKGDPGEDASASAIITYQTSENGTDIPEGEWTSDPVPERGKYLWSKTVYVWNNGYINTVYSVSYSGIDGLGAVTSVNEVGPDINGNIDLPSITSEEIDEICVIEGD